MVCGAMRRIDAGSMLKLEEARKLWADVYAGGRRRAQKRIVGERRIHAIRYLNSQAGRSAHSGDTLPFAGSEAYRLQRLCRL